MALIAMLWVVEDGGGPRTFDNYNVVLNLLGDDTVSGESRAKLNAAVDRAVAQVVEDARRDGRRV